MKQRAFRIMARLLLLLPSLVCISRAAEEWSVDPATGNLVTEELATQSPDGANRTINDDDVCSLYLAPSAIPNAGLGVYTGVDLKEGDWIGWDEGIQDLFVPIYDKYKTIPYRGKQRFLSWLGYVWPIKPDFFYPSYHDGCTPYLSPAFYKTPQGLNGVTDGPFFFYAPDYEDVNPDNDEPPFIPLNAFAPGIASLANSHPDLVNIELMTDSIECDFWSLYDDDPYSDPFEISPHHGVSFGATRDIPAGSEFYLFYGVQWHKRYEEVMKAGNVAEYETLEQYLAKIKHENYDEDEHRYDEDLGAYTEQAMRDTLPEMRERLAPKQERLDQVEAQRRLDVARILQERRDKSNGKSSSKPTTPIAGPATTRQTMAKSLNKSGTSSPLQTQKAQKDKNRQEIPQSAQTLEWLQQTGACLDNISVDDSTIEAAGRGAFANRFLSKGSVVAAAPLLALKREDLTMYDVTPDRRAKLSSTERRVGLNMTNEIGTELLLNYCYGHPESELLLVPYTPIVNFINHNADPSMVNAQIRWPSDETAVRLVGRTPQEWLNQHPLDVTDQSGKLLMEFVALRDIQPDEEIFIDYGPDFQAALDWYHSLGEEQDSVVFRHRIHVPNGFYPPNWLNQVMEYQVAPIVNIQPGEILPLTWQHNGQPISKSAFVVGLPEGFTQHVKDFADERGINSLYQQLLSEEILGSDEWFLFDADQHDGEGETEQWFAQRFKTESWGLNIHYIGAWNRAARTSLFRSLGSGGFDVVLDSIGNYFGLDSITCFMESFMGVSQAENSFMHTDVYATGEKGFNILFPIITVNGSHPELDVQSDNADLVVAVKYEHDRAIVLSEWGYHRTSTVAYDEHQGEMRVVVGMYCAQMDETNHEMLKWIYTGEPPAPFFDQFNLPIEDYQWSKDGIRLPK